jgi:arylsulfatase
LNLVSAFKYDKWGADRLFIFILVQGITAEFFKTFVDFPPVMGSSLGVDKALQQLKAKPQN